MWGVKGTCKENEICLSGTRLYGKKLSSKDNQDSMQPDFTHVTLVGDYCMGRHPSEWRAHLLVLQACPARGHWLHDAKDCYACGEI